MKAAVLSVDPSLFVASEILWIFMLISAVVCLVTAYRTKDKIQVATGKDINWVKLSAQAVGEVDTYKGKASVIRYIVGNVTYEKEVGYTECKEVDIFYNKTNPSKIIPAVMEKKFRRHFILWIVMAVALAVLAFAQLIVMTYIFGLAMKMSH